MTIMGTTLALRPTPQKESMHANISPINNSRLEITNSLGTLSDLAACELRAAPATCVPIFLSVSVSLCYFSRQSLTM